MSNSVKKKIAVVVTIVSLFVACMIAAWGYDPLSIHPTSVAMCDYQSWILSQDPRGNSWKYDNAVKDRYGNCLARVLNQP